MGKSRDSRIELLRIFSMFLIFICHFVIHINWGLTELGGWKQAFIYCLIQSGQVGVVIFFIITGWFMVNRSFRFKRLLKLWIQVFLYSLVIGASVYLAYRYNPNHFSYLYDTFHVPDQKAEFIKNMVFPVLSGEYWFVTAYVGLLLLSPFLNKLITVLDAKSICALVVILVAISVLPIFGFSTVPYSKIMYAITCYLIGVFLRKGYMRDYRLSGFAVFGLILICFIISAVFNYVAVRFGNLPWFYWGNQLHDGVVPLQIVAAALIFYWVMQPLYKPVHNDFINSLGSATFGIYLIHENHPGYVLLWSEVGGLTPKPHVLYQFVAEFVVFVPVIFLVLMLGAFAFDYLIVHPVQKVILQKL